LFVLLLLNIHNIRTEGEIPLRDVSIDGSIILKRILKDQYMRLWTGIVWPTIRTC